MAKAKGKAVLSLKDLDKRMLADASDASARTATVGGNTIGIRNSKFTYKNELIGKTLEVVVVDYVHTNAWYDTAFDPDNPAPPACVAISVDGDEMAPVKTSPKLQSEYCDGCELNAWGSADVGRGKACGEQYKLAVVAVGPGEDYSTADMAVLTLPPTSRQNWTKYVKDVSDKLQRPPYGVLTEFSFDGADDWPVLVPEFSKKVGSAKDLNDIYERRNEARDLLTTPPDFSGYTKPTRKKVAKKKAAKKKATRKKAPAKKASKKRAKKKATKKKAPAKSKFS